MKYDDKPTHHNGGKPIHRKFAKDIGPNTVCPKHSIEAGRKVKAKDCGCLARMKSDPYFIPAEEFPLWRLNGESP